MNIFFKTHFPWPGPDGQPEPTHFHSKILAGHGLGPGPGKLHTIRRVNGKPRYREDMKLVMCMGSRFKPVPFHETVCTGTQLIEMETMTTSYGSLFIAGRIDGEEFSFAELETIAGNDGLTYVQFVKWFTLDLITRGPGTYQIVHWSDVRY